MLQNRQDYYWYISTFRLLYNSAWVEKTDPHNVDNSDGHSRITIGTQHRLPSYASNFFYSKLNLGHAKTLYNSSFSTPALSSGLKSTTLACLAGYNKSLTLAKRVSRQMQPELHLSSGQMRVVAGKSPGLTNLSMVANEHEQSLVQSQPSQHTIPLASSGLRGWIAGGHTHALVHAEQCR